jgi:hypothetical protein
MQREERVTPIMTLIRHSVTMYIGDWKYMSWLLTLFVVNFACNTSLIAISVSIPHEIKL